MHVFIMNMTVKVRIRNSQTSNVCKVAHLYIPAERLHRPRKNVGGCRVDCISSVEAINYDQSAETLLEISSLCTIPGFRSTMKLFSNLSSPSASWFSGCLFFLPPWKRGCVIYFTQMTYTCIQTFHSLTPEITGSSSIATIRIKLKKSIINNN